MQDFLLCPFFGFGARPSLSGAESTTKNTGGAIPMRRLVIVFAAVALLAPFATLSTHAQSADQGQGGNQSTATDSKRFTRVLVGGDSTVQARPDTAIITVSVVTQNKNALNAQQEN